MSAWKEFGDVGTILCFGKDLGEAMLGASTPQQW